MRLFWSLFWGLISLSYGAVASARTYTVAIIDSGIANLPALAPLLEAEYDMAAQPGRRAFHPRYDHGTMVATILAHTAKVPIRIVSFRIDDPAGCPAGATPPCQPSGAPVANAIRQAARLGVDAINISLSMGTNTSIVRAVRDAAVQGIPVIMAAGNEGKDHPGNADAARAGYPNAVLVGALNAEGGVWSGTNRPDAGANEYKYVWERGVAVPTISASGTEVFATGTSFATPIATAQLLNRLARQEAQPTAPVLTATSTSSGNEDAITTKPPSS